MDEFDILKRDQGAMFETAPTNTARPEEVQRIIELQAQWPNYVVEREESDIKPLIEQGLVAVVRDEQGNIIASLYKEVMKGQEATLLAERVYRWGGVSADEKSKGSKRGLVTLIKRESAEARAKGMRAILTSANPPVGDLFSRNGWQKLTYEECSRQYPEYLGLYTNKNNSLRSQPGYYEKQNFYILRPAEPPKAE